MARFTDRLIVAAGGLWAWLRHPDLIRRHRLKVGVWPTAGRPRSFNDKMLWRKIHDHNPLFVTFSDKVASKAWFAARCPDLPLARLLWSGARAADIPAALLRPGVIVKGARGCKLLHVVTAADRADRAALDAKLDQLLVWVHGEANGEWAYSRVAPALLVEELLTGTPLVDLNVFTLGPHVAFIVATVGEKTPAEQVAYFDTAGRRLPGTSLKRAEPHQRLPADFRLPCPPELLVRRAVELAGDLDFARVDFMWANGGLHACEITVYPGAGYKRFTDPALAEALTTAWDLRRSWFLSAPQRGWRGVYARALRRLLDSECAQGSDEAAVRMRAGSPGSGLA